jgi:predicted protein tyrosine phosphatase
MKSSDETFQQRLFICGVDERIQYGSRRISHLIAVANPGATQSEPSSFAGGQLHLRFGDVTSEADAQRCKTTAPNITDIERAIAFFRQAWVTRDSKIVVSCDYGASRSPALAYLFIADQLGAGREAEALRLVLDIRPVAVPNGLVVRLGDAFLNRRGALLQPLKELYAKINAELFPKVI